MNAGSKFLWNVRRELWEHRSIYIAPLVVAAISLLAFLVSAAKLAGRAKDLASIPPAAQAALVGMPYGMVASVIMFTGFAVALVFSLDALYAERRDRSILFWKSMPVSDTTSVLAKAFVPVVVMPVVVFAITLATQIVMVLISTVLLAATGGEAGLTLRVVPLGEMTAVMLYGLVIHTLWVVPVYGYLMLASAFAKRAPFLWAAVPLVGIMIVEKIAIGTSFFIDLVKYRITGAMQEAFSRGDGSNTMTGIAQLEPVKFLTSVGLWTGLVFAAACFAAAIFLRRRREPI